MNTILGVLEAVWMVNRGGGRATTKNVGKLAHSSFYRTRRLLKEAERSGLVTCYNRVHRANSTSRLWLLTPHGSAIVDHFGRAMAEKGWQFPSASEYLGVQAGAQKTDIP